MPLCCPCMASPPSWPRSNRHPPELQELLGAIAGNQPAMDAFVSLNAGTMSPDEFFDPDHLARVLASSDS